MDRRETMLALFACALGAAARVAIAQDRRRTGPARIAVLDDAPESTRASFWAAFRRRLNDLGYVDGSNAIIEQRWAGGDIERLPALASELVAWNPDVMVVVTTTVALAAKKATSVIPIVAMGPADPVQSGLVQSLGRPGGNVTGVAFNQAEIAGKWVELARELVPRAKSIVYLTDTANPGEMLVYRAVENQAVRLGMYAQALDGVTRDRIEQSFAKMRQARADVLVVATTASLLANRRHIVEGAARLRIPAIYARQEYAEAGGLLAYGASSDAIVSRGADYVHRILQGARPADLPFEMASKYRLVVNAATARMLDLQMPQAVLARADEVIGQ